MAAAGCYADCVSEGSGQVRRQEVEFLQVWIRFGEDFEGVG
ncbi:hypothetical protein ACFWBI_37455 [Streptomyces sp. NPDC059982]